MEKTSHCTYWPLLVCAGYEKDVNVVCASLPKTLGMEAQQ